MSENQRHDPERREMDLLGNVFKRNWKWIMVATFGLGGIWATLQGQVSAHTDSIKSLQQDDKVCHDFMVAQAEVNKKIEDLGDKFDKLDRYLRRRP